MTGPRPAGQGLVGVQALDGLAPTDAGLLRLWLIDLRAPVDPALWQACSDEEQARAARFRFERDARRYRAAHGQMRGLLADALGCAPAHVRWHTNPHGKPMLDGHEGWHFNVSHSGEWALLALSHGAEVGVDLECQREDTALEALVQAHFTAEETQAWLSSPQAQRCAHFYRTWVCKEAALKALGTGLSLPPQAVPTHWQTAWAPCRIDLPPRAATLRIHGLPLSFLDEAVEAAVALIAAC